MTKRVTFNNITKAIEEKTGDVVSLWRGEGYFYFYSDDDDVALWLSNFPSASVYVFNFKGTTIEWWVDAYEGLKEEYERWI